MVSVFDDESITDNEARHLDSVMFAAQRGTTITRSGLQPAAKRQSPIGAGAIATPPTIPQQPLIRGIYNWGDDVAVITDEWMP